MIDDIRFTFEAVTGYNVLAHQRTIIYSCVIWNIMYRIKQKEYIWLKASVLRWACHFQMLQWYGPCDWIESPIYFTLREQPNCHIYHNNSRHVKVWNSSTLHCNIRKKKGGGSNPWQGPHLSPLRF